MKTLKDYQELLLISLLEVAHRRISREEIAMLEDLTQRFATDPTEALDLQSQYWRIIVLSARAPVLEWLLAWYDDTDGSKDAVRAVLTLFPEANYTVINTTLRSGIGMMELLRIGLFLALRGPDEVPS